MEAEGGGVGGEETAKRAATKNRWSVRPHEQLIGMVILAVAFIVGSLSVDAGLRSRNELPKDRSDHRHRFCRKNGHRRYFSMGRVGSEHAADHLGGAGAIRCMVRPDPGGARQGRCPRQ